MIGLRIVLATALLGLFTVGGNPTLGPVLIGALCGFSWLEQGPRVAAISAVLSWGGLLLFGTLRGQPIGEVASKVGSIMGVPGIALVILTILYPVILSTAAAYLAAQVSPIGRLARRRT